MAKTNATVMQLEGEVATQEGVLAKAEQDRADKDDQIRTLKDEIAHQGDMITKLGKEKRSCADGRQKTEEDIQAAEDKCNHLSRVKGKLEQALDEAEDALEREKKVKGDVEKAKRKVEGDLKLTQEAVSDLERVKGELKGAAARKDKEGSALAAKIDDEATLGSKYAKQAKELQARLEELDEELAVERGNRSKAEKSRTMLKKDIEDVASRLEEAGSNTSTQVELNKKREAELARLKSELEELNIAHEGTLAALRMKHNNTMADLGEQIDSLSANKVKSEKDKANMELDLRDARCDLEDAVKGKADLDKTGKLLQGNIVDANTRLDEMARALNEAESSKKRLQVENQDLSRQIDELEAAIANMNKGKISVTTQLEDTKALADAESKDRSSLLTKYKMMATDLENLREKMENEAMRKSDALKALSKAQAEIQLWKSRFETEGMGRVEELEAARNKLQSKIVENEELVDALTTKVANAEKSKTRMNNELDDLAMEYERVHAAALITEKRGKNFDKVLGEWQSKAADVSAEVAASQDEGRNYTSELFRLKAAQDEGLEQLDLDKQRRRLEVEKEELQSALEEAEAALEQEENKVLRAQLELGQVRQEIDRRIQEKEEEFDNTRKNHQRAMESLGASLEAEQRAKAEALRIKKKLESDINELEIALDHANKANSEGQKAIKRYQGQLRDTIQGYEDEARSRQQVMEQVGISERKANALSGEVEESRALLDSAERAKRQLDSELADARNAVNEMGVINSRAMHDKRNVESLIHTLQAEIDDALAQAKNSEEKSKRAMVDAARLADELRSEQDHANAEGRGKRSLDTQLSELENRLAEAEAAAMKGGKAAMSKLEMKIRELEVELGGVQSRTQENYKAFQRAERRIKELQFQQDEDKKNQDRMSDLAQKLQAKIKTYKQQIEEAEEIAALNLAKYRKAQQELEETEERSKLAEAQITTFSSY